MGRITRTVAISVVVALAMTAGAWWWQRADGQRRLVAQALPMTADLGGAADILHRRVLAAETRARSRFGAAQGLADLSRLYHANGFLDEAMQCYRGLEQLAPMEPRWPHLHATILAGYGEVGQALVLWARVIQLAPDYIPARLRAGDCQLKSNLTAEAAATYDEVLRRDPGNAYAQLGLARIDLEKGRLEAARDRLERIVEQTHFELGYDLIVSLYERTGQSERAASIRGAQKASGAYRDPRDPWVDSLLDECVDPYQLSLAAGVMARTGSAQQATRLLERAIEYSPDDVAAWFQLGAVSYDLGDLDKAFQQFSRCTVLAPDFADGWARLSLLQAQRGEMTAADRTLARGLENCPQSPGLHLMRAKNLLGAGRVEEAIVEFRRSIQLRPNEPDAYIELAKLFIGLGRVDQGIEQVQAALMAEPGNPVALGILAFHAISTGDEAKARAWLKQVRDQPRVPGRQVDELMGAYRRQFSREWTPTAVRP